MSIKKTIENWIIDDMTPKQVRYLSPILASQAKGQVAEIYQQARKDFQLVPPITLFSPFPDLLAVLWSVSRESQIASGIVSRSNKEAVAAAVSTINTCPYCVDAHAGMLYATSADDAVRAVLEDDLTAINSEKTRHLVQWALATRSLDNNILHTPPFSAEEAPEIVGTALLFHFVNRMVSVFLTDSPLPIASSYPRLRKLATRIFGATAAKTIASKTPFPGESLKFISAAPLPDEFAWARNSPVITDAWAGFIQLIETSGEELLSDVVRNCVQRHLQIWQGQTMGLGKQWLQEMSNELSNEDKAVAELLLLTAFAPYQVDEQVITRFRQQIPEDRDLLAATAWASLAAVKRINICLSSTNFLQEDKTQ